jgi:hypothetical protein
MPAIHCNAARDASLSAYMCPHAIYKYMYIYIYVCIYICMCVYICIYMYTLSLSLSLSRRSTEERLSGWLLVTSEGKRERSCRTHLSLRRRRQLLLRAWDGWEQVRAAGAAGRRNAARFARWRSGAGGAGVAGVYLYRRA